MCGFIFINFFVLLNFYTVVFLTNNLNIIENETSHEIVIHLCSLPDFTGDKIVQKTLPMLSRMETDGTVTTINKFTVFDSLTEHKQKGITV